METILSKEFVFLLIILFVAHLLADFVFQTDKFIAKKKKPKIFLIHISIAAALPYIICGIWTAWYIPVVILVSHAIIDLIKLFNENKKGFQTIGIFVSDQLAHIIIIIFLAFVIIQLGDFKPYWYNLVGDLFIDALTLLGGLVLTVKVSGLIIGLLVKPLLSNDDLKNEGLIPEVSEKSNGITGGGEVIGQLERLLIFFFVLAGVWEAIGFLVAAKSIFRFGELKDKENRIQAEYILIGTLYSFSFGIIFSWFTGYTLTLI